ncbi:MAG: hypothetical protein M1830_000373, partial [Pleopsidium flavum]
ACLPTMRPIFKGHSPESLLGSFRSKMPVYWQTKGSASSVSKQVSPSDQGDYPSSLSGLTKSPNDAVFESHIEGTRMSDLEVRRDVAGHGIMVSKGISYRNESV